MAGDNANHREIIEKYNLLENCALIQSKEKLYSLMATNMDVVKQFKTHRCALDFATKFITTEAKKTEVTLKKTEVTLKK